MAGHVDTPNGKVIEPLDRAPRDISDTADGVECDAPDPECVEPQRVTAGTDEESLPDEFDRHSRPSPSRLAALTGALMAIALAALTGWLGFQAYQSHQAEQRRELFVQVARQGALNLTTIDWEHADADVKRVVDSATGTFKDDFAARSQPFVEVVKKAQSKSVGAVIDAGIESISDDKAQVLVAISVKTTLVNQPEQPPHSWRMRISVQKVDDDQAKVSDVTFVP